MKFSLIIPFIISFNAIATDLEKLMLVDAVQLSQVLSEPLIIEPDLCEKESGTQDILCTNSSPEIKPEDYSIFQLNYPSLKDVPAEFKSTLPGSVLEGNTQGEVRVVVAMPNDNKLLGLWGIFFNSDGDDDGYTHGTHVTISQTRDNNITYQLKAGSDVYTDGLRTGEIINDTWTEDVHFTNDNYIKLLADNVHQNKAYFWKAGVGWKQLDSKNWKSPILATGQQFRWHNFLQQFDPGAAYDPIYKENGDGIKNGINIEGFFGLQKNLVFSGGTCRVKVDGELGANLGTIPGTSYVQARAGTYFFYQKPGSKFSIMSGGNVTTTKHFGGTNLMLEPTVGASFDRMDFGLIYHHTYGPLHDYTGLNKVNDWTHKNDSMMSFRFGYAIGRFKKK